MYLAEKYLELLKQYKYISFDLYDTLVFRLTDRPTDIFDIVEGRLLELGWDGGFKKKRLYAERMARTNAKREDVTLDEIYSYMEYVDKDTAYEIECCTEVNFCIPNEDVAFVIKELHRLGKIVIIITDMYLPRAVLMEIIDKCEIPYDMIFISGEEGKAKYYGTLYEMVLERLGIAPNQLIHIGDNHISDYERAREKGINAVHYDEPQKGIPYFKRFKDNKNIYDSIKVNRLYRKIQYRNTSYEIGYSALAPFITSFCEWVHRYKKKERIDELWFFAREGWLLKKAYDRIYPEEERYTRYVRLNKNVLRYPIMGIEGSQDLFSCTLPSYQTFSLRQILEWVQITDIERFCQIIGANPDTEYLSEDLESDGFKPIYDAIRDYCDEDIKEQYEMFKEYLSIESYRRVGIVNNSLNGNGQVLLEKLCGQMNLDIEFVGFQFFAYEKCHSQILCHAYLEDAHTPPRETIQFIKNTLLFEHLLFEKSGTARRFVRNDDVCTVECEQRGIESNNDEIVDEVQKAVIDYVYDRDVWLSEFVPDDRISRMLFFGFLDNPSKRQALKISGIWDKEGNKSQRLYCTEDWKYSDYELLKKCRSPDICWSIGYLVANGASRYSIKLYLILMKTRANIRAFLKK